MNNHPTSTPTRLLPGTDEGVREAARILAGGGLVALPTETVYGLAVDATDGAAVARLYAAKGRPSFNPLIAHLPSVDAARRHGLFDAPALALARAFWPGPLTLVTPLAPSSPISDLARAGLGTVGLRVPSHPLAQAVLAALGRPVAMPSANLSGHVSPTEPAHVLAYLDGRIDTVLDGGRAPVGVESTIVACIGGAPRLLRPGGVPRAAIEAVIGRMLADADGGARPIAPGLLASHYAPAARVVLDAVSASEDEGWLGFGPDPEGVDSCARFNLSPTGDLAEAAANLFGALRRLDAAGVRTIRVARIPATGLGEAIRDRLIRAAAPRS
jgi:L-threonylcarbamoyladenylate synthase